MRLLLAIALISQVFSIATVASALTLDEARKLALAGDVKAVERAFQAHQAKFETDAIARDVYVAAYHAFETTHPDVDKTTRQWLEAHPDSSQALAARGIQIAYRADLIRGAVHPDNLSEAALETISELADTAAPLLQSALKSKPNLLAAAGWLDLLGAISRRMELRVEAMALLRDHDDPDHALLAELRFIDLSWGTTAGAPEQICGLRTKNTSITRRQCVAIARLEQANAPLELWDEWNAQLRPGPTDLFPFAHYGALMEADPKAAFDFAKSWGRLRGDYAQQLGYAVDFKRALDEFVVPALAYDPMNPHWRATAVNFHLQLGDINAAWLSMAEAMKLGSHHPRIRGLRIMMMEMHATERWKVADELMEAFTATGGSMVLVSWHLTRMLEPESHLTHNQDGSENAGFVCTRLLFLERHKAWCKKIGEHHKSGGDYTCAAGYADRRNKIVNALRIEASCGQAVTWKDRLRYLLDLTE